MQSFSSWLQERSPFSQAVYPNGFWKSSPLNQNNQKKQWKKETKYHCLQIKTRKHMGGGRVVKLLQEAGKCDYKYNIKQIQNILHWANGQTSLINYKRRHSNYMIESEHSCSQECAPMLSTTSRGGVRTPSFTAKEACTDSNHHHYQPEKIETEGNPIKYMACSLFWKNVTQGRVGKKCIAQQKKNLKKCHGQ